MNNKERLIYLRKCISDNVKSKNPDVYYFSWLFIREIIYKSFDIDPELSEKVENDNQFIIDKYIHKNKLNDKIHRIRKNFNEVKHKSYSNAEINFISEIERTINEFIDYINNCNPDHFQFNFFCDDEVNIVFENDDIIKNVNNISFYRPYSKNETSIYRIGYNNNDTYFQISNNVKPAIGFSVFAVIHNLLIRSDFINISSFLSKITVKEESISMIFIYEIMILRAICAGKLASGTNVIKINEKHVEEITLAIKDILYYFNLISKMANLDVNFPIINFAYCETKNEDEVLIVVENIEIKSNIISVEKIDLCNSSIILDEKIPYKIRKNNLEFYQSLLFEIFRIDSFRPGQIDALDSILNNKQNHLIILPTGYGKSLIYQFIAIIQPCVSFIISTDNFLISDQVDNLNDMGISRIGLVDIIDQNYKSSSILKTELSFLSTINYTTPQKILTENNLELMTKLMKNNQLGMVSIDECHQMSLWGHQFNVEYFTLIQLLKDVLNEKPLVLFSATAAQRVKTDISIQLSDNLVVIQPCPLKRSNISYEFKKLENLDEISKNLITNLKKKYTAEIENHLDCPSLTIILNNDPEIIKYIFSKISAVPELMKYCTCFSGEINIYKRFKIGNKKILLTTDKYLTGINISFLTDLYILGFPTNKEWFYQETGRVGRFGQSSKVYIYYTNEKNNFIDAVLNIPWKELSKYEFTNNYNESNLEILFHDMNILENSEKSKISNIYKEISRCVMVSSSNRFGRVIGSMSHTEKRKYDFPVFILFFVGIIGKWSYAYKENDNIKYRYYINLEIDNGTLFFEEFVLSKIRKLSYSNSIGKKYEDKVYLVNEKFENLFDLSVDWVLENSWEVKRQMFINMHQLLLEQTEKTNSQYVEENVSDYFGVGSKISAYENSVNSNKAFNSGLIKDILSFNFINHGRMNLGNIVNVNEVELIRENENDSSLHIENYDTPPSVNISIDNSNELNIDIIEHIENEKIENVIYSSNQDVQNFILPKNLEKYSLKNANKNTYDIKTVIKDIVLDQNLLHNKNKLKPFIERSIEEQDAEIYRIVLSIFEMLSNSKVNYFRTRSLYSSISSFKFFNLLNEISPYISNIKKKDIDNLLISMGSNKFYFRGLLGWIKSVFY